MKSRSSRARAGPPIVDPVQFLLATRDTGYRSTALAVAEFVDNSLCAGARSIDVHVKTSGIAEHPLELTVTDNGRGMDRAELSVALTFGGSTHFGDRSSLGRYGMGLPNGSLSQARRVEVYTWRDRSTVLAARLDLDELLAIPSASLPGIEEVQRPPFVPRTRSGTLVRLVRCDRLEYRRASALARRLEADLGRIFRRFITDGVRIGVNGQVVQAFDPTFLERHEEGTSTQFGDTLLYRLPTATGEGSIRVRFSELPVDRWHRLSVEEKRDLGITGAPSVSVLRSGREIDRGWFFMGSKRRENYDDWWRCEVEFDPALDELFGLTHAKQAITPGPLITELLASDLEPIARALNTRVRRRFELLKAVEPLTAAEKQAARAHPSLPPLPRRNDATTTAVRLALSALPTEQTGTRSAYRIVVAELSNRAVFEVAWREQQLVVLLNARHPFYRDLYGPLALSDSPRDQATATQLALTVLAAGWAELGTWRGGDIRKGQKFRQTWADVMASFLNA